MKKLCFPNNNQTLSTKHLKCISKISHPVHTDAILFQVEYIPFVIKSKSITCKGHKGREKGDLLLLAKKRSAKKVPEKKNQRQT